MENPNQETWQGQINEKMRLKTTYELLDIWEDNDRSQWSDEAFQVIHDILIERTGSVPEQDKWPRRKEAADYPADYPADNTADNTASYPTEDTLGVADEEDEQDTYHRPDQVLRIAAVANVFSWIVLGWAVIIFLSQLPGNIQSTGGIGGFLTGLVTPAAYTLINIIITGGVNFFIQQAISHGLKLLMDIDEDIRQGIPED